MNHPLCDVTDFSIVGPYALRVAFDDGVEQIVNLEPVLYGEMFGPLRELQLFNQVYLDQEVRTLVWPNVAGHDHPVRLVVQQHRLEPLHDQGRLLGMRTGADSQVHIRLWQLQLIEEHLRHTGIIVLAGVDEDLFVVAGILRHLADDRRDLHKIGPCAHDVEDTFQPLTLR